MTRRKTIAEPAMPASVQKRRCAVYTRKSTDEGLEKEFNKGRIYPGEHRAIVPRALWNKVHALLQTSPRARAAQNRRHQTALLKGLIFGLDARSDFCHIEQCLANWAKPAVEQRPPGIPAVGNRVPLSMCRLLEGGCIEACHCGLHGLL